MNKRLLHAYRKFLSCFLLAALSFYLAPRELIHDLYHHHDTCDTHYHSDAGDEIGEAHQHCDILQLSVPPLFHDVTHFSFESSQLACNYCLGYAASYYFSSSPFLFFRGPPLV